MHCRPSRLAKTSSSPTTEPAKRLDRLEAFLTSSGTFTIAADSQSQLTSTPRTALLPNLPKPSSLSCCAIPDWLASNIRLRTTLGGSRQRTQIPHVGRHGWPGRRLQSRIEVWQL